MRNQSPDLEGARRLVLEHGWNSTCYQVLNEGILHWWSADKTALVGYVRSGRTAIVAGAPVCAAKDLARTVDEWEAHAEALGLRICYFGAEERLQSYFAESRRHVSVALGFQPEWRPSEFVHAVNSGSSLRGQINRARNKGVRVSEWAHDRAESSLCLGAVLHAWLSTRGLPTLHFLVEPETLGDMRDRRIFVAERDGKPIGFVTLCPVPARNGWLTEQFVREPNAPNGTVELMLYEAANSVQGQSEYWTMGIVPLLGPDGTAGEEPRWLRLLRGWATAHYVRFYNFRGLSEFKTKFHPDRRPPVLVIVKDTRFRFAHLRAISRAFTITAPEVALAIGLGKAVRTEFARLRHAMTGRHAN